MKSDSIRMDQIEEGPFLLALHSSSETLGVAFLDSKNPQSSLKSETFPIGRKLSNKIITCVEKVLPSSSWSKLCRLAVAIGPGSFTGTRVSVVMARMLAQQLNCSLDGISNFALMAPRLAKELEPENMYKPFWIKDYSSRKGVIAGSYQLRKNQEKELINNILEIKRPHLLSKDLGLEPSFEARDDVKLDVIRLLEVSLLAHQNNEKSLWNTVLPIYTSSPV